MTSILALVLALPLAALLGAGAWLYTPDLPAAALEREYAGPGTASRFVEVDGLRIHYRDEGEGPPVVLLHGFATSLFLWDGWAERLRADRRRVIRLDLPGHGLTGPDPRGRYAWPATADLVAEFMDRIDVPRADIGGSSLGGAVAYLLAARHPERVDRLVLAAPVGYAGGEEPAATGTPAEPPLIFRLLANPSVGPRLARLTPERLFAGRVRATYADPSRLTPAEARQEWRLFRREGNRDAVSAMLRGGGGGPPPDPGPVLARIEAPTLILWGAADPVAPPAAAGRFARAVRGAEVALVPDAGHAPMRELPDASLAPVLRFLERHP